MTLSALGTSFCGNYDQIKCSGGLDLCCSHVGFIDTNFSQKTEQSVF